ncbi:MAG: hypothetical protein PHN57_09105 [Candidatus Omnitrophica bacterium]|nr:hypothetical protein [Candidatus Omnitrophota bacterium]
MKNKILKQLLLTAVLCACLVFVVKFGLPQLLRAYIVTGIGDCAKIPVLCMTPKEATQALTADRDYIQGLVPYKFPKTNISAPKGFKVVQELVSKPYYKRRRQRLAEPVIYVLHQPPGFFLKLFPQVKSVGVKNNYEFMRRLMQANESGINSVSDAFFVILKSIFTPDLGDQRRAEMIQFRAGGTVYFISYNLTGKAYFFDCTILPEEGDFFKVYIKDNLRTLDLNKVFSIISTVSSAD